MKKSLSLLEMVVSLLVMSVIVATSLKYGSSAYSQYKYSANQKKLENIQIALKNYFKAHGRLPRPSLYENLTTTDDKYGKEKSNSTSAQTAFQGYLERHYSQKKVHFSAMAGAQNTTNGDKIQSTHYEFVALFMKSRNHYGIIPFKELNLTEQDIIDEFGHFIEYMVPEIMTLKIGEKLPNSINLTGTLAGQCYKTGYGIKYFNDTSANYYPCPDLLDENNHNNLLHECLPLSKGDARYSVAVTQYPPTEKLITTDRLDNNYISDEDNILFLLTPTTITIKDIETNKSITDSSSDIAYVLISHGPSNTNQKCYLTKQSSNIIVYSNITQPIPQNEEYKIHNCGAGFIFTAPEIEKAEYEDVIFYQGPKTDFFDDQIAYSSLSSLLLD